jgi:hypothetical protein
VNTPPVIPGLRPHIWLRLLRLVTKAMSDRLLANPRLAQQLVPFRLIVERNVEQAAPPVRTGRGASLQQDTNRALMPAVAVTTVLERMEQASLEGEERGGLVVLLLAERARSEGARSTRAFEDQPGRPLRGVERRKPRDEKAWKAHLFFNRRSESMTIPLYPQETWSAQIISGRFVGPVSSATRRPA